MRVRADERLRSRVRFLSLSLSILIFCPNYCLLKGEHYYLTYYGLWLICFMRFMSANNTLNCFMFLVRSIDRWLLCRTNDTKKKRVHTHNLRMLCAVGLWSRAAFFLSRYAYIILVGQPSHGKSKTILLSTRVRRQFFMRFIHPYRELSLDAIKLNMIKNEVYRMTLTMLIKTLARFSTLKYCKFMLRCARLSD